MLDIKSLNSRIQNKTTFFWISVWQYHFVWDGSGSPSATPNSVILPHRSPGLGSFIITLMYKRQTESQMEIKNVRCQVYI